MWSMTWVLVWGLVLAASLAWGQNLSWDKNTEADMSQYNVYVCPSNENPCVGGTQVGFMDHADAACTTGARCETASSNNTSTKDVLTGQMGFAAITAVDTSGNESGRSTTVGKPGQSPAVDPFDFFPPGPPQGLSSH